MPDYTINPDDPLPRYYQVYKSLIDRIKSGEFHAGDSLPAERQLAKEYGVSRITIVKALDTLQQDKLIDRQQGRGTFVVDPDTSGEDTHLSVAFLTGVFDHPYLFSVLMSIAHHATERGCHLQVMGAYENSREEIRYIQEVIARGMDGLIVYPQPGYANEAFYRQLQAEDFPVVMIDRYYPQVQTDRVTFNDREAARQLTHHMLNAGHRRIAVLPHHEIEATSVRDRIRGYRQAVEEFGLHYDEELIWLDVYSDFNPLHTQDSHDQTFKQRLQERLENDAVTAILAINQDVLERVTYDLMDIRTSRMRAVIEGNGSMKEYDELDVEIASFSHKPQLDYTENLLTALAVHSGEQLGRHAMELLIGRIRGKVDDSPQSVTVPMEIIIP